MTRYQLQPVEPYAANLLGTGIPYITDLLFDADHAQRCNVRTMKGQPCRALFVIERVESGQ